MIKGTQKRQSQPRDPAELRFLTVRLRFVLEAMQPDTLELLFSERSLYVEVTENYKID